MYFAELQAPLDFGTEPLTQEMEKSIGVTPPEGSLVQARLSTELSSATARKGDPVEATLSRPLFDGKELIFPQGSRLKGSVVEVRPARHLSRNGQLRLAFREIAPPEGSRRQFRRTSKHWSPPSATTWAWTGRGRRSANAEETVPADEYRYWPRCGILRRRRSQQGRRRSGRVSRRRDRTRCSCSLPAAGSGNGCAGRQPVNLRSLHRSRPRR